MKCPSASGEYCIFHPSHTVTAAATRHLPSGLVNMQYMTFPSGDVYGEVGRT